MPPWSPRWYHLTDRARFKLDPNFTPADNAIAIDDGAHRPGIYLGQSVETWVNGFGYWRPFVAEFQVDPEVLHDPDVHGRWGGELFVPPTAFHRLTLQRVIPIDAHAREEYGMPGWIEGRLGTEFDTGRPISRAAQRGWPPDCQRYQHYRYPGPDVRGMPQPEVLRLKRQLRQALRLPR